MAITVGTDTYITVAEADTYIASWYISTDTQRVAWTALATADKEVLLRNATEALEQLKFIGAKYDSAQTLSFPRGYYQGQEYYRLYDDYVSDGTVPDEIKNAQAEEAIELASPTASTDAAEIRNGYVKSYSIGKLSETYRLSDPTGNGLLTIIKSLKAQRILLRYLSGGFEIV